MKKKEWKITITNGTMILIMLFILALIVLLK